MQHRKSPKSLHIHLHMSYKFINTLATTVTLLLKHCCMLLYENLRYLSGVKGPSGYGSNTTAEEITSDYSPKSNTHLTAIVTGATSGIGAETARVLAKRGLRVVIPARNMKKAAHVKESILKETPRAEILLMEIDLSSFASVERFCHHVLSLNLPLNILINNAGRFSPKLEYSEDKVEATFATNYLGHFLLTKMLLDKMVETAVDTGIEGRIINVSSVIHSWVKNGTFCFSQLVNPKRYDGTRAYAQSKLANILHSKEMARHLQEINAGVTINAVHPGIVKTGIMREYKGFITDSIFFIASKLLKSVSQGASTICYVALSTQTKGVSGKYFADCNEIYCSSIANDEKEAKKIWKKTNALIPKR